MPEARVRVAADIADRRREHKRVAKRLAASYIAYARRTGELLSASDAVGDPKGALRALEPVLRDHWEAVFRDDVYDALKGAGRARDLDTLVAASGRYTGMMGKQINEVSDRAFAEAYNAAVNKGWDRALAWQRVSRAYGLDPRQMRAWITAFPSEGYQASQLPAGTAKQIGGLLRERGMRIGDNEAWSLIQTGRVLDMKGRIPDARKMWLTAADELVCPTCAPLHEQVVALDDDFDGFISPPLHVNCRCDIVFLPPEGGTGVEVSEQVTKAYGQDKYNRNGEGEFSARESRGFGGLAAETVDQTLRKKPKKKMAPDQPVAPQEVLGEARRGRRRTAPERAPAERKPFTGYGAAPRPQAPWPDADPGALVADGALWLPGIGQVDSDVVQLAAEEHGIRGMDWEGTGQFPLEVAQRIREIYAERGMLPQEGGADAAAELARRKGDRKGISAMIGQAASEGDLRENAGYDAAMEEQGLNEAEIRRLEGELAREGGEDELWQERGQEWRDSRNRAARDRSMAGHRRERQRAEPSLGQRAARAMSQEVEAAIPLIGREDDKDPAIGRDNDRRETAMRETYERMEQRAREHDPWSWRAVELAPDESVPWESPEIDEVALDQALKDHPRLGQPAPREHQGLLDQVFAPQYADELEAEQDYQRLREEPGWDASRDEGWSTARNEGWDTAREQGWDAARDEGWSAARSEGWELEAQRRADDALAQPGPEQAAEQLDEEIRESPARTGRLRAVPVEQAEQQAGDEERLAQLARDSARREAMRRIREQALAERETPGRPRQRPDGERRVQRPVRRSQEEAARARAEYEQQLAAEQQRAADTAEFMEQDRPRSRPQQSASRGARRADVDEAELERLREVSQQAEDEHGRGASITYFYNEHLRPADGTRATKQAFWGWANTPVAQRPGLQLQQGEADGEPVFQVVADGRVIANLSAHHGKRGFTEYQARRLLGIIEGETGEFFATQNPFQDPTAENPLKGDQRRGSHADRLRETGDDRQRFGKSLWDLRLTRMVRNSFRPGLW